MHGAPKSGVHSTVSLARQWDLRTGSDATILPL